MIVALKPWTPASWPMPRVMGILNVSPESFSGDAPSDPVAAGRAMIAAGADIVDVGGESTRPGARPVEPAEERRRVIPVVAALAGFGTPISIDTRNAETMRAALDAGATIVNDVSGLAHDPNSAGLVAARGCVVVLMHMRGTPETMGGLDSYGDLVAEVGAELAARIAVAEQAGVRRENIVVDPGIGFAKTAAQNLELLRRLDEFSSFGLPILVGVSRKSFIGRYGGEPDPLRRGPGSIAAALFALGQGANMLRVHDVGETIQALRMWQALSVQTK